MSAIDKRRDQAREAYFEACGKAGSAVGAAIEAATQVTEAQLVGMSDALAVARDEARERGEAGTSYGVEAGLRHVLGLLGFEIVP